jgi:hypothetical protein
MPNFRTVWYGTDSNRWVNKIHYNRLSVVTISGSLIGDLIAGFHKIQRFPIVAIPKSMISEVSSSLDKKYKRRTLTSSRFCSFFIQQSRRYVCTVVVATLALTLMLATFTLLVRQDDRVLSVYQNQIGNDRTLTKGNTAGVKLNWPVKKEPKGMKLVWLMSFPNSGTSFTSRVIRDLTKTDSASNYADETPTGQAGVRLPVFDSMPDGPFWINKPEQGLSYSEPREYVITKVCFR